MKLNYIQAIKPNRKGNKVNSTQFETAHAIYQNGQVDRECDIETPITPDAIWDKKREQWKDNFTGRYITEERAKDMLKRQGYSKNEIAEMGGF